MVKWCSGSFAALLALLLAACAPEATDEATAPAAAVPAAESLVSGERLLAEPPADWVQSFRTDAADIRMVEYVPGDTSDAAGWVDKVSFESFATQPLPNPDEFVASIAAEQRKVCGKLADHETFSGIENGYPTAVRLLVCYSNPLTKKGQLTLLKAIRGDDNFYVITRSHRVPPIQSDGDLPMPPELMAEWSMYLRAISVCNDDAPGHPCITPAAPAAEGTTSE